MNRPAHHLRFAYRTLCALPALALATSPDQLVTAAAAMIPKTVNPTIRRMESLLPIRSGPLGFAQGDPPRSVATTASLRACFGPLLTSRTSTGYLLARLRGFLSPSAATTPHAEPVHGDKHAGQGDPESVALHELDHRRPPPPSGPAPVHTSSSSRGYLPTQHSQPACHAGGVQGLVAGLLKSMSFDNARVEEGYPTTRALTSGHSGQARGPGKLTFCHDETGRKALQTAEDTRGEFPVNSDSKKPRTAMITQRPALRDWVPGSPGERQSGNPAIWQPGVPSCRVPGTLRVRCAGLPSCQEVMAVLSRPWRDWRLIISDWA